MPVDLKNFSLKAFFKDALDIGNNDRTRKHSAMWIFRWILFTIVSYGTWRIVRIPHEWYYHYKDPLASQLEASPEDNSERLRYKQKIRGWWRQDY